MLDSLRIKNFRSLQDFEIPKLGRVNLLVGKNNSGKSTVLEALRLYAGNAQRPLLDAIAQEHDDFHFRISSMAGSSHPMTPPLKSAVPHPANTDSACATHCWKKLAINLKKLKVV